jgi:hypothetical protein
MPEPEQDADAGKAEARPDETKTDRATPTPDSMTAPVHMTSGANAACDLSGTFALRQRFSERLAATLVTEGFENTQDYWLLVRAKQSSADKLKLTFTLCGTLAPDICSPPLPPLLPTGEAYAYYNLASAWDPQNGHESSVELVTSHATPKATFEIPAVAQLTGIELSDPYGAFPTTYKDVEGNESFDGTAVNGAKWVDADRDGQPGLTTYSVPPGGVMGEAAAGLPKAFGAESEACPRNNPNAPRSPYAFTPALQGAQLGRMSRAFVAQRVISEFHGTLESCDRIVGDVTGPEGAQVKLESLPAGCMLIEGSDERMCDVSALDAFTGSASSGISLQVVSGRFSMVRVADDINCEQVRAAQFE